MRIFWNGVQLYNGNQNLSGRQTDLLRIAEINAVKIMTGVNSIPQIAWLRNELDIRRWVVRFFQGGQPSPPKEFVETQMAELDKFMPYLKDTEVILQPWCEPNHLNRHDGFGPGELWNYVCWLSEVICRLRDLTDLPIVFPPLAGLPHPNWIEPLIPLMRTCNFASTHCYWQLRNHLSKIFGGYYEFIKEVTDQPILVLEYGDSTHERAEWYTPEKRPARVEAWLEKAIADPQIWGSFFFIAPGVIPENKWQGFWLDFRTAEAMGNAFRTAYSGNL